MKEWSVQHKDLFGCAAHARRSNIDKMESLQLVNATTKALYAVREKCFACLDGKHKPRVLEGPQKRFLFGRISETFFAISTVAPAQPARKNFNAGKNTSMNLFSCLMLSLFTANIISLRSVFDLFVILGFCGYHR